MLKTPHRSINSPSCGRWVGGRCLPPLALDSLSGGLPTPSLPLVLPLLGVCGMLPTPVLALPYPVREWGRCLLLSLLIVPLLLPMGVLPTPPLSPLPHLIHVGAVPTCHIPTSCSDTSFPGACSCLSAAVSFLHSSACNTLALVSVDKTTSHVVLRDNRHHSGEEDYCLCHI